MPLTFILQEEGLSCQGRFFFGVFFGTWWFLDVSAELVEGITRRLSIGMLSFSCSKQSLGVQSMPLFEAKTSRLLTVYSDFPLSRITSRTTTSMAASSGRLGLVNRSLTLGVQFKR